MSPEGNMLPFLFLKPGEILVSHEPMIVTTLLGSCVAVTMFSPKLRMGGICHALLPTRRSDLAIKGHSEAGKYVDWAIRLMLEGFLACGLQKYEIEAKLFGGSDMFETSEGRSASVGRQNMEKALTVLEDESVRLITKDLGGPRGRKIIFHTHTGEVFLKRLRKSEI